MAPIGQNRILASVMQLSKLFTEQQQQQQQRDTPEQQEPEVLIISRPPGSLSCLPSPNYSWLALNSDPTVGFMHFKLCNKRIQSSHVQSVTWREAG